MPNNFRNDFSAEYLRDRLHYDEISGRFTWLRVNKYDINPGDLAGHAASNGYITIRVGRKNYLAHRLAWLYVHGVWPEFHIDHIDGEKSNNGIANLRECTASQNGQNKKSYAKRQEKKSKHLGVSWDRKTQKWTAQITLKRKNYYLGRFHDEDLARDAYLKAKAEMHDFN